ncbi:MAG: hypothetical protein RLZZ383_660 [Pseudomonadota bacterium]|jgi:hypothetical protein
MPRWPFLLLLAACSLPENPPVTRNVQWSSSEAEAIARRACYDCHSNETTWRAYHRLPGINGSVKHHVKEGREMLNFSTWDQPQREAEEAIEVLQEGEMPLASYVWVHPEADLSADERQTLIDGLRATLAADPPIAAERRGGHKGHAEAGEHDD